MNHDRIVTFDHVAIVGFFIVIVWHGIKATWRTRNDPNTRRGHFAQHSVSAVGRRDGRSVGQILRTLGVERQTPLSLRYPAVAR